MHHPVVAQILISHLLVIARTAIQTAAGQLPAGRQNLGQGHIFQQAGAGVGHRHLRREILPLRQAGRIDRRVISQEPYGQTQAFAHRRLVAR